MEDDFTPAVGGARFRWRRVHQATRGRYSRFSGSFRSSRRRYF